MWRRLVLSSALLAAVPSMAAAQDPERGKAVFNQCRACHQVGEGAKNTVGPILNGIVGRKAGSVEGYSYSEANEKSGLTWDEETLRKYLKNPREVVPGTKMIFAGLRDEKQINDVIAYLKQLGPDGKMK